MSECIFLLLKYGGEREMLPFNLSLCQRMLAIERGWQETQMCWFDILTSLWIMYFITITNIGQSDVNFNLVGFTVYLAVGGLLASYIPSYFFPHQVERRFHSGDRTAHHSIKKWVPLHYHLARGVHLKLRLGIT